MTERSILMVEDNEDDVILIQRALRKGGVVAPIHVARDGDAAVDFLAAAGQVIPRSVPLPTVVLLDLKLPRRSGLEVLQWIRATPAVATLPVVIFSTSAEQIDLDRAYASGANSYLKKPGTVDDTAELLKIVGTYWLRHNEPPPAVYRR